MTLPNSQKPIEIIRRVLCCGSGDAEISKACARECPHGIYCNIPSRYKDEADFILAALRDAGWKLTKDESNDLHTRHCQGHGGDEVRKP